MSEVKSPLKPVKSQRQQPVKSQPQQPQRQQPVKPQGQEGKGFEIPLSLFILRGLIAKYVAKSTKVIDNALAPKNPKPKPAKTQKNKP